jgi:hypothetical protein
MSRGAPGDPNGVGERGHRGGFGFIFGRNTWTGPEYPPTQNLMKSIREIERETGVARRPMLVEISPKLRAAIVSAPWKATTYVAPHEYIMEYWFRDCLGLIAAVRTLINEHGYYREFRGAKYPTVHLEDHYYWQMPGSERWPLRMNDRGHWSPICLNRAKLPVAI